MCTAYIHAYIHAYINMYITRNIAEVLFCIALHCIALHHTRFKILHEDCKYIGYFEATRGYVLASIPHGRG